MAFAELVVLRPHRLVDEKWQTLWYHLCSLLHFEAFAVAMLAAPVGLALMQVALLTAPMVHDHPTWA